MDITETDRKVLKVLVDEQKRRWEHKNFQRRKADAKHTFEPMQFFAAVPCVHEWNVVAVQKDSGGETLVCTKCGEEKQCWFE